MAEELLMPKLGMTMEEGVLTEWFKQAGDEVEQGDPVFEVMTDKINIEVEAPQSGVLLKILVDEGETVPVNQIVGYIGEAEEEVPEHTGETAGQQDIQSIKASGQADPSGARPSASDMSKDTRTVAGDGERAEPKLVDYTVTNGLVRATPSARRLARIHNMDLHTISGTGPRGRIQARDVEQVIEGQQKEAVEQLQTVDQAPIHTKDERQAVTDRAAITPGALDVPAVGFNKVPFTGIRKIIAERMVQSVQQVPHVTLNRWVTMEAAYRFKKEWEEAVHDETGYKLSINDLLVMAASRSLNRHLELNATLDGDVIRQYEQQNIGIAVQTDDGLMVPVIHEVNRLNVGELVKRSREKIEKARKRKLSPEDLTGGTFTISNLGGYDIETFTPIINQPQAAILGVGKMVTQPEWDGETWVPVKKIPLSLSFDHRLVDGAPAAAFLQTLARYLEQPRKLLI